ncbi:TadE/TadG family type IV pilus assembly protein, partial [Achromobacter animicus]|uniref:TadE/TadG family type IV pilus assembly protein n=1 Tax=Achromobacter animicus TaxID=1389935 RepID=UPI0035E444FF
MIDASRRQARRNVFVTPDCPYRQAVMGAPHCAAMTAFIFSCDLHAVRRQHGAAALEFAVAGAIVLLLGLLCVEAARWHGARQMAHLALM